MKRNHSLPAGSTSTPGERHCALLGLGMLEEVQQSTSALPGWGGLPGWWLHCDSSSWAAPRSMRRHLWQFLHGCMQGREHVYSLRSSSASKHSCLAPANTSWQAAHAQGIPFVIPCPEGFSYSQGVPCSFSSDAKDPDYGSQGGKALWHNQSLLPTLADKFIYCRQITICLLQISLAAKLIYCWLYFKGKSSTPWIFVLNCGYLLRTSTCFFQLNWFFQ